ncbi:hypothetical protein C2G38_2066122 [Gigaspora rosea]|uniref:Uncharacterized protein n=1 Tax=Gigaspora rosea TaxID=44941 RepID=A0A397W0Z0_9GLOM|nr:hypothetical protein C2G38_2066122 [Gigaspora rosea]
MLGQEVLHFDTIEVTFNERNITKPEIQKIIIPVDILKNMREKKDNYQIYATILHTKEEVCEFMWNIPFQSIHV